MADFAIQRDTAQIPNAGTSITITAGTEYTAPAALTSAFIKLVSSHHTGTRSGGSANVSSANGMCWIANPGNLLTSIDITRYGTTDVVDASWEIVEYIGSASGANEFVVRGQGAQEVTGTGTTGTTGAVSNVVTDADVVPWLTGQGAAATAATILHGLWRLTWNSGDDTITATRQVVASNNATFSWAAVEFTGSNWLVQLETHTMTAAASTETETLGTTVTTTRAFIHTQFDAPDDECNDQGVLIWLSDGDTVSFLTVTGAATGQVCHAWVISNSQTDGTPMVVARYSDTTNFTSTTLGQTVTAVTMAETTIDEFTAYNAQATGSSMCEVAAAELTTTTNVALWRSRGLNTLQYRLATVSWPTAAAGTVYQNVANAAGVSTTAVSLAVVRALGGVSAAGLSTTTADLVEVEPTIAEFTATVAGVSTAAATLYRTTQVPAIGNAGGTSTATIGGIEVTHHETLGGATAAGSGTVSVALSVTRALAAQADGLSTVTSEFEGAQVYSLTAGADGVSTVAVSVLAQQHRDASAAGVSTVTASMLRQAARDAQADGTSTVAAQLAVIRALAASAAGTSSSTVTVSVALGTEAVTGSYAAQHARAYDMVKRYGGN